MRAVPDWLQLAALLGGLLALVLFGGRPHEATALSAGAGALVLAGLTMLTLRAADGPAERTAAREVVRSVLVSSPLWVICSVLAWGATRWRRAGLIPQVWQDTPLLPGWVAMAVTLSAASTLFVMILRLRRRSEHAPEAP